MLCLLAVTLLTTGEKIFNLFSLHFANKFCKRFLTAKGNTGRKEIHSQVIFPAHGHTAHLCFSKWDDLVILDGDLQLDVLTPFYFAAFEKGTK